MIVWKHAKPSVGILGTNPSVYVDRMPMSMVNFHMRLAATANQSIWSENKCINFHLSVWSRHTWSPVDRWKYTHLTLLRHTIDLFNWAVTIDSEIVSHEAPAVACECNVCGSVQCNRAVPRFICDFTSHRLRQEPSIHYSESISSLFLGATAWGLSGPVHTSQSSFQFVFNELDCTGVHRLGMHLFAFNIHHRPNRTAVTKSAHRIREACTIRVKNALEINRSTPWRSRFPFAAEVHHSNWNLMDEYFNRASTRMNGRWNK